MKKELIQSVLQEHPGLRGESTEGGKEFVAEGEVSLTFFTGLPGLDAVHRVSHVRLRAEAVELVTHKSERYVVTYPRIKALKFAGSEGAGVAGSFAGFRSAQSR